MSSVDSESKTSVWKSVADSFSARASGLNLRQRILLILCLAALPAFLIAFSLAANKLAEQTREIETSMERLARIGAAQHDAIIEKARGVLETIAVRGPAIVQDPAVCELAMSTVPESRGMLSNVTVFDSAGRAICSKQTDRQAGPAAASWFAKARDSGTFVLGDYTVGEDGVGTVNLALPLMDSASGFAGAVALGLDPKWLDFVASTVELPDSVTLSSFDTQGRLLSNNSPVNPDGTTDTAPPSESARQYMSGVQEGTLRAEDTSGRPRVYGFQRTDTAGIVIAAGSPPYAEFVTYTDALLHTLAAPLAVLGLTLLAAGFAAEMFVARHVRQMTRTAEEIKSGDYSERTSVPYDEHEIGELAVAFDDMADTIEMEHKTLTSRVERSDVLIDELNHRVKNNFQTVLSMLEMNGMNISASEAQRRLKGLSYRLRALAEIHRVLYEDQNSQSPPNVGAYVRKLSRLLNEAYDGSANLRLQLGPRASQVRLSVADSISLGLILNELISNAQKHAFAPGRRGTIRISLSTARAGRGRDRQLMLRVTDSGNGLPAEFELGKTERASSGLRLVQAMTRHLNGEFEVERLSRGTGFLVRFPI